MIMLGDKLRKERERQNLTVKDVEKGTSIRALYIECIEKGDYQQLPGEVYTKGFIRNYATFLKLDADALVRQYTEENHPEEIAEKEAAAAREATESAKREETAPFSTGDDYRRRLEDSHRNQNNMVLVAIILLVVAGGAFFMLSGDDSHGKPSAQQTAQTSSQKKPSTATTTQQQATQTPQVTQKPQQTAQNAGNASAAAKPASEVDVTATYADRCWTQVIADGEVVYEGTIEAGKTMSWKGKERVEFTAGNAGAVELTVNGKSLGKAGESGQIAEKVYTKAGEAAPTGDDKQAHN